MTRVRRFQDGDLALIVRMSCEFLSEVSLLNNARLSMVTLVNTIDLATNDPNWFGMIGFVDEKVAGMVVGRRIQLFFSEQNICCDTVFFVRKEFRGTLLIKRLIREFEKWGSSDEDCVGVQLNAFAGGDNERGAKLAEVLGFPRVGFITYKKRK